ncbi:MAG: ABC transporter substrate-binding protein [Cyclobacteriaceae bacterium]|nr:ABC transporter substrate-binding protein [Cyclobacteriaceae bacterium HetDA_MAG_MS6]
MKLSLIFAILISCLTVFGQGDQSEYLEAKRLFREGQYREARSAFSSLSDSPLFGPYASFYLGLSAYRSGSLSEAQDMWRQILIKHPSWDQNTEVLYWLAYSSFESGSFRQGIRFSEELATTAKSNDLSDPLIEQFILPLETARIDRLQSDFPQNDKLASLLAERLLADRTDSEAASRLNDLVRQYEFDLESLASSTLPTIKKEEYKVGVVLPFMFESLANPIPVVKNTLVMELFQGMQLAAQELMSRGINIKLLPYDTKRSEDVSRQLTSLKEFQRLDLIVGPLFPGPSKVISAFSKERQINMINPISSNEEILGDNKFSFLFKPSYITSALALAEHAKKTIKDSVSLVYYSPNSRDSLTAALYKEKIEKAGFTIVDFRSLDNLQVKQLADSLVMQHEEYFHKRDADSLLLLPGRHIKTRRYTSLDKKYNSKVWESLQDTIPENDLEMIPFAVEDEDQDTVVYYEMTFDIPKDSIGHIMMSTRSNGMVNAITSAVEARNDSTQILGYGDWLKFKIFSYDQWERLNLKWVYPEFIPNKEDRYQQVYDSLMNTYHRFPSEYQFLGYEITTYVGEMLDRYGKYFQNGFFQEGHWSGGLMSGARYMTRNDNQVVPIVKFENTLLKAVRTNESSTDE